MRTKIPEKNFYRSFINGEYRWVLFFALVTMLIMTLPYLLGFLQSGEEWQFTGFVIGAEDGNSYIAKMLRGANGDWLFHTPYTAYPQHGVFAYFPYLFLGKLARPPAQHEKLILLFHLFRIFAGICMIFATYDFIGLFIKNIRYKQMGVVVATWGGGLGWLLLLFHSQYMALEFCSPESFGFLILFGLPHLAMATALLFWGLILYLRIDKAPYLAGIAWLIMGIFQPLNVPFVWVIVTSHLFFLGVHNWLRGRNRSVQWAVWWHWVRRWLWTVAISSPLVIYTFVAFNRDPVLRQWTAQNRILSPPLWIYLIAYGLLLPFVVLGIKKAWLGWNAKTALLIGWVVVFPFLIYAPYNLQRRLAEGFWLVLIVLFLLAVQSFRSTFRKVVWFVLFLSLMPAVLIMFGAFHSVAQAAVPQFRPADEVAAFTFLAKATDGQDVVMSSFQTGNALPAWAPVFVVIGHGPESVYLDELKPRVASFYQVGTDDPTRRELLSEFDVDYVFWGPSEQSLGDWHPVSAGYLVPAFQQGDYAVFRVVME